jgi:2-oxoglutarate dehydrogenase E2 component (dihydrolipoamide succinyltransferase)
LAKTDILMPQMGESIAEGTVVRWLKQVGDTVERDEPLFEFSTDKVDAEIPAPTTGVLIAIHAAAGTTAAVNSAVGVIQSEAGEAGGAGGAGAVQTSPPVLGSASIPASGRRVSPVARVIAVAHNIDLQSLAGTGAAGRITKQDVLARVGGASALGAPSTLPALVGQSVPLSVMRRKIAEHMIASRRTSAHVHSVFEVDCSRIEAARAALKGEVEAAGAKLSVLPFIVVATAAALREMPLLNASLDGDSIAYHGDINVGIAVALDNGLIVPVIRHADALTLKEIAVAIADLAKRARARQLTPEEVAGGTFTVTNPGNFGGTFATPIINQPQVAILAVGSVEKRVLVRHDALAIRPMMDLTLGFDHRLIDGVSADRFLGTIKHTLETWS